MARGEGEAVAAEGSARKEKEPDAGLACRGRI